MLAGTTIPHTQPDGRVRLAPDTIHLFTVALDRVEPAGSGYNDLLLAEIRSHVADGGSRVPQPAGAHGADLLTTHPRAMLGARSPFPHARSRRWRQAKTSRARRSGADQLQCFAFRRPHARRHFGECADRRRYRGAAPDRQHAVDRWLLLLRRGAAGAPLSFSPGPMPRVLRRLDAQGSLRQGNR